MNDRVSRKPPSMYMREEEAMDHYRTLKGATGHSQNRATEASETVTFYDAGINSSKPSSMFRFGKAIVNAFNPANVWQGINGIWRETEDSKSPEKSLLQERQAKAEKAYAELKKSGFKGTKAQLIQRTSEDLPTIRYEDVVEAPREIMFRDSGIDMDGYRSSTDHSKDDQLIAPIESSVPPLPIPRLGRSPSPMVGMSSVHGSSLSLHKPSFRNLQKVKSHFNLSPTKRAESELSLPLPSVEVDATANAMLAAQPLRNQPSRKELVKQQKLTKRVSDLETKLEKTRRELGELQEPSKLGVKPFKPGALASLPSQRVLNAHGNNNELEQDAAMSNGNGNTTKKLSSDQELDLTSRVNAQLQHELTSSVSRTSISRKRKSCDVLYKPGHDEDIDADDSEFNPASMNLSKRASARSRKSQKIEEVGAIEPTKAENERIMTPNGPRRISSHKTVDPVPPLPESSEVFDPVNIDQAKILSMRSAHDSQLPFGKLSDDIINLRAVYPSMAEAQLVDYIGSLPANKEKTDYKSLSHQDRPASPFLAPPLSALPIKTRARKIKRGISPPPPSLISPKRRTIKLEPEEMEDAVLINSEGQDTVAPLPESLTKSRERVATVATKPVDKPVLGIQEDYEWPEDVF